MHPSHFVASGRVLWCAGQSCRRRQLRRFRQGHEHDAGSGFGLAREIGFRPTAVAAQRVHINLCAILLYNDGMAATIDIKLTGIAHGGEALGTRGRRTIFVPYALPGETVRVRLIEEHQRWARGELVEVLEPSAERVQPSCPHFGHGLCSGCQWQHISRAAQLISKAASSATSCSDWPGSPNRSCAPPAARARLGLPRPGCFLSLRPGFAGPAAGGRQRHPCHRSMSRLAPRPGRSLR